MISLDSKESSIKNWSDTFLFGGWIAKTGNSIFVDERNCLMNFLVKSNSKGTFPQTFLDKCLRSHKNVDVGGSVFFSVLKSNATLVEPDTQGAER